MKVIRKHRPNVFFSSAFNYLTRNKVVDCVNASRLIVSLFVTKCKFFSQGRAGACVICVKNLMKDWNLVNHDDVNRASEQRRRVVQLIEN